jgi:hypothetical protein
MKTKIKNKKRVKRQIKKIVKPRVAKIIKKKITASKSAKQKIVTLGIGIHDKIPAEVYHTDPCKLPSLSASIAHIMLSQSPHHAQFNHPRLNKLYRKESNGHFDLGTAAHEYILEGSKNSFVVIDAKDYATKSAREQRDMARTNGRTPILAKKLAEVMLMAEIFHIEVEKCPDLRGVFKRGKPEQTAVWCEDGIWLRSRYDWLTNNHDIIVNYKTAEDANPDSFIRGPLVNFGYDLQAEFYIRGLRTLSDRAHMAKYIWVVQEVRPPYAVSIVGYSDQMADTAHRKVEHAIALWKECTTKNIWPSYPNRVAWAYLPDYAVRRWEEYEATQGLITSSEQLS